jgi:membrane protein DedA with SNARE-associated domain
MDVLALLGLVGLLFVKEAGVPVPIPGDLLVLGAGVAADGDVAAALSAVALILLAGYAGGSLQFLLARGTLRRALLGLLARLGIPLERLDALAAWLRRRGALGVAVARASPGLRIGAIAACGLAALPLRSFLLGLVIGNTIFVGGHFALGFIVGPTAIDVVAGSGLVATGAVALLVLAVTGALGWSALRRRAVDRRQGHAGPAAVGGAFTGWAEAACPACLVVALAQADGEPMRGSGVAP